MASELHPWRFELEICPSRLPCGHVFEPKLNAQQGAISEAFFRNALSRAHRGVPTSLWLGPIDSLPFATVVFWLHIFFFFFKEKHGKKTLLSTFHCNQLQHTHLACFKTDLPDYFRFNFVQVITEPCGSVVLSWRDRCHLTETRDFQLQMMQLLEALCLFSFKSTLLHTSGKCQCIRWTACMFNFIYTVTSTM